MRKLIPVLTAIFFVAHSAHADEYDTRMQVDIESAEIAEHLECARGVLQRALYRTAYRVDEFDFQEEIQMWVYDNFHSADNVRSVLQCLSGAGFSMGDVVRVPPVGFRFPGGREIIVNYTVPYNFLRQRMVLAARQPLPSNNASDRVGDGYAEWVNTNPAWYGIMVVCAGCLDRVPGVMENRTLSLSWLRYNWRQLYPGNSHMVGGPVVPGAIGGRCTSVSALANDWDIVNMAAKRTTGEVDIDAGDTDGFAWRGNDFFVAGYANLRWITWAQVAADVALIAGTFGASAYLTVSIRTAQLKRQARQLTAGMRALNQVPDVQTYRRVQAQIANAENQITSLRRARGATNIDPRARQLYDIQISQLENALTPLRQQSAQLLRNPQVLQYSNYRASYRTLANTAAQMRAAGRVSQTGNAVARPFRVAYAGWTAYRAARVAGGTMRATRVATKSFSAARINNYLFHSTMRAGIGAATAARRAGWLYGIISFAGDMYSWSVTEVGDFTSNIPFAPLLLLSADNIQGQENVVNHGMWLMWAGDSTRPEDDDAALLQAFDFAHKFHQDMEEVQHYFMTQRGRNFGLCDVDIYIVRPIIRNPNSENAQLYYLIMNDVPWEVRSN